MTQATAEAAPPPTGAAGGARSPLRSVGTVASLTMLSRLLGFARDVVMARQLGLDPVADAFFVAWTLPNLFRRLFGEGALSAAFVPVFVEAREKGRPDQANRLASAATNRLALGLVLLVVFLEAVCWAGRGEAGHALLARHMAPAALEHLDLALALSQILLPYLVFICLSGLLTGALNALDHFAAPAAAPCVLNLVWIAALLFGTRLIDGAEMRVRVLSWALLGGGAIQLVMHVAAMKSLDLAWHPTLSAEREQLAKMRGLFYSVVFGLAVFQVNSFIDQVIAYAFIPAGGVSTIFFANRLTQLPIGTIGIAVATAVFPELSRLRARGDRRGFDKTTDDAMGASFFISLPCAVGLAALATPIVRVLFERGEFGPEATARTARVVLAFAGAVAAGCITPTITRAFYAEQDTKTPVRVSVAAVVANFLLNLALVVPLQEAGLALATSISQVGQLVVLYLLHSKRRREQGGLPAHARVLAALARALVLGAALALAAKGTESGLSFALGETYESHAAVRAAVLGLAIGAGAAAYLGLAWLCHAPELEALVGLKRARRARAASSASAQPTAA